MVSDRSIFEATCLRVAQIARNAGLQLEKAPKTHELIVSRAGREQRFPIVTDPRDWRQTSVEEAFYAVVSDALAWILAHPDAAPADDKVVHDELPMLVSQRSDQLARIKVLSEMLGGEERLHEVWRASGADDAVLAGVHLA